LRGFGESCYEVEDAVFERLILVAAGVRDQVLGADGDSALDRSN